MDPTGPAALTCFEVAHVLTGVLGRPSPTAVPGMIRYVRHAHQQPGMPWGMVAVTAGIDTVARFGRAAATTDDVLAVTDAVPIWFWDWVVENPYAWMPP